MSVLATNLTYYRPHSLTSSLEKERQDITRHKQLCQPFFSDQGVPFAVNGADDPSEFHVNGSGKESGCDEKQ